MGDHQTFVFLHAHPDDEAIFTGGTIARLTDEGHRVVVVYATAGELGRGDPSDLAEVRREEAQVACDTLGVERVVFLDYHDSGLAADARQQPWGAFAGVVPDVVAEHIGAIVDGEQATALVTYDMQGVYGHPDHIHAHEIGATAAQDVGLASWYAVTVDREYLHFVETHVAALAGEAVALGTRIGSPTVEISTTVDVRPVLDRKYRAIAAHRSQVGADPSFGTDDAFAEVYGFEWFIRHGAPTALDALGIVTANAPARTAEAPA